MSSGAAVVSWGWLRTAPFASIGASVSGNGRRGAPRRHPPPRGLPPLLLLQLGAGAGLLLTTGRALRKAGRLQSLVGESRCHGWRLLPRPSRRSAAPAHRPHAAPPDS